MNPLFVISLIASGVGAVAWWLSRKKETSKDLPDTDTTPYKTTPYKDRTRYQDFYDICPETPEDYRCFFSAHYSSDGKYKKTYDTLEDAEKSVQKQRKNGRELEPYACEECRAILLRTIRKNIH